MKYLFILGVFTMGALLKLENAGAQTLIKTTYCSKEQQSQILDLIKKTSPLLPKALSEPLYKWHERFTQREMEVLTKASRQISVVCTNRYRDIVTTVHTTGPRNSLSRLFLHESFFNDRVGIGDPYYKNENDFLCDKAGRFWKAFVHQNLGVGDFVIHDPVGLNRVQNPQNMPYQKKAFELSRSIEERCRLAYPGKLDFL